MNTQSTIEADGNVIGLFCFFKFPFTVITGHPGGNMLIPNLTSIHPISAGIFQSGPQWLIERRPE